MNPPSRTTRIVVDVALVGAVMYALVLLGIMLLRAGWDFELEWMEGGMISHAARLLDGQPIYAPPSADFVPFFYTPGYPLLLAGLAKVFGGLDFALARGVSVAATVFTLFILYRIGRREAGWRWGLLAAGLYAGLFRSTGAFYDLARPDALFIALVASASYVAYFRRSYAGAIAAGAIFAVAFMTKQTTSVFIPAVGLYLLWRNWRHALIFGITAFGLTAGAIWIGTRMTDGWMWTYIFEGHQGHLFYWKNILLEYWRDVLFVAPLILLLPLLWFGYKVPVAILSVFLAAHWTYAFIFRTTGFGDFPHMYYRELWYLEPRWALFVPPALIALLFAVFRAANHRRLDPPAHGYWLLMFVAGAGSSGLNHSTQWAYSNSLMPLALFACALIPLAVRDLTTGREGDAHGPWRPRFAALVPAAVVVQLVAWIYDPWAQVPDDADAAARAQLDARLAQVEGSIFFPAHPLYSWHRDGKVHTHQMGIADVAFMGGVRDLPARLRAGEWAAVVVDARNRVPGLGRAYYVGDRLKFEDDALMTRTGFITRPAVLWLKQDPTERPLVPGLTANFEGRAYTGWTTGGDAFGRAPTGRAIKGRQGRLTARSSRKGSGTLTSRPFEATAARLTMLVGGRGAGAEVRVKRGDAVVARHRVGNPRRLELRRIDFDLTAVQGETIVVEAIDRDAKSEIAIDDLRLAP